MDESGSFEGQSVKASKGQRLLFTLLIPDLGHERLMENVQKIQMEFGFSGFMHATEIHSNQKFQPYLKALLSHLATEEITLAVQCYQDDIHVNLGKAQQEIFAANRYLSMAQTMFEHLFFLAPEFHGQDLDFALHPNSRVSVMSPQNKVKSQMEAIGYTPHKQSGKGMKGESIFYTWTNDIISSMIHRMAVEYSPWQKHIGQRNFSSINTIVAEHSSNPLVHMVDHLAWIYAQSAKGYNLEKLGKTLRDLIVIDLRYGTEHVAYRAMIRASLNDDMKGMLVLANDKLSSLVTPYYKKTILAKIEQSLTDSTLDPEQIEAMERLADTWLRQSKGNWSFVLKLTSSLIRLIGSLPEEKRLMPKMQRLLFHLHSHQLSIHNHRGEDADAAEAYDAIEQLNLGELSLNDYRERIAIENRISVTLANIFDFEGAIVTLKPNITALEQSLKPLQEMAGQPLKDPLIGKLRGTIAQACAFISPRKKEYFIVAEAFFQEAASSFSLEEDRLRHQINLLHLYLDDVGKSSEAADMAQQICNNPNVEKFLRLPSDKTAQSCQFALAVLLKYDSTVTQVHQKKVKKKISLDALHQWFGEKMNEHPFELLCAYLGRTALESGNDSAASDYFNHALAMPFTNNLREQPTLQVIRAQIFMWWAMGLASAGRQDSAREKVISAKSIMEEIGQTAGLESILALSDMPPTGWFAPGWAAIQVIDWDTTYSQAACESFLQCFTFNYH